MGPVEWFLGQHFKWNITSNEVCIYLSQTGFDSHLVEDNNVHLCSVTPDATPHWSGLLIDAIPESDKDKESPTILDQKCKYQSIDGSIGWLAQSTHPNLAPSHSFLLSYSNNPLWSYLNAAFYALHYIHSTIDYGFTFSSKALVPLHTYMSFPHRTDTEAYMDTVPPSPDDHHHLTTHSNTCWGSQIGNAICARFQLPLFKFRSMSGAILFQSGCSITWKANHQDRTSLSSCEADIQATNMGSCLMLNTRNIILDLSSRGYPISDAATAMPVFNNNDACVQWCHNLTTKGKQHIEHHKNVTREWVADGFITVSHVSIKCNPANISIFSIKKCVMLQTSNAYMMLLCVGHQTASETFPASPIQHISHPLVLHRRHNSYAWSAQAP